MLTKRTFNIIVATIMLSLIMVLSACLPASPAQVQAALEKTQAASAITPTLQSHEVVETNIAADFATQTGQPPAATSTLPVPTNTKVVVAYSPTPGAKATVTNTPRVNPTATVIGNDAVVMTQPMFSVLDTTDWEYAAQFFAGCKPDYHGIYINRFDTLYVFPGNQIRLEEGGTLKTDADHVILFATGNYRDPDPTHNGAITKYCVEGDTGIYLLPPNSTETIKTGLVYVTLTGWNGETEPRDGSPLLVKGDVRAEACENRNAVVEQIQAHMGTEEVFALLDDDVNINPDARYAWGWDATVHALAGKSMVWTRTGEVGTGWSKVTSSDGKSLYVANRTGNLDVTHPFSGLQLCHAYPGYDNLNAVTTAASPSEGTAASFTNAWFADLVTSYRGEKLFEALGLVPSVVYERGTHETKWNTFVITSAGVTDPNLIKITELNTLGGYRVLYFVKTDSVTNLSADFAVITVPDAFSPADVWDWWK